MQGATKLHMAKREDESTQNRAGTCDSIDAEGIRVAAKMRLVAGVTGAMRTMRP